MNRVTLCLVPVLALALAGCGDLDGREIRWSSGDIELAGTLVTPDGDGPFPLAVFVPGSGCMPRDHRLVREHATELATRGLAVFVYDKRGCGHSDGDWRDVPLEPLADDVLAVLPVLAADPAIDANRVGLMGLSQGGWVSLIAAGKSSDVRYVVMLSCPPTTPAEQGHAVMELRMRDRGWSDDAIAAALEVDRMVAEVYRTDHGWEACQAAVDGVSSAPWFEDAGLGLQPRDSWNWQWYRTLMDYDPMPALLGLEIPILAVYGEKDLLVPATRSRLAMDALASSARGPRDTVLLEAVGHQLRPGKGKDWPDDYWAAVESWCVEQGIIARGTSRP